MNINDKTSTIWSKEERMQWKAFWNSKESDHPRAYEVAGNLIKQVAKSLKNLVTFKKNEEAKRGAK